MSCRNLMRPHPPPYGKHFLKSYFEKKSGVDFRKCLLWKMRLGPDLLFPDPSARSKHCTKKTRKDENIFLSCFSINPIISQLQWDFVLRLFFEGNTHFRSWCSWHLRGGRRCPRCRTPSWSRPPPARAPRGKAAKEKTLKLGWRGHVQGRGGGGLEREKVFASY